MSQATSPATDIAADPDAASADAPGACSRPVGRRCHLRRKERAGSGAELRIRGVRDETARKRPLPEQCRRALAYGAELLADEGGSLGDVVRVVYVLRDPDAFAACYPIVRSAFEDSRPAVALRMVNGFDHPGVEIELDLVAHLP